MSEPQPSSPRDSGGSYTESTNSPLVICDSPGDNTHRPARRKLPYFPGREPPEGYSGPKPPPDKELPPDKR
jgi:hypothetical protein